MRRKELKIPTRSKCIEKNPTMKSILFGDQFINLSAIARARALSVATMSKIFNCERNPSVDTAEKMAEALRVRIGLSLRNSKGVKISWPDTVAYDMQGYRG